MGIINRSEYKTEHILSPFWQMSVKIITNKEFLFLSFSGQRIGLVIHRSLVRVPLWPLAGFVLGCPKFKSLAMIVNSQLVATCQLGFLILLCCI